MITKKMRASEVRPGDFAMYNHELRFVESVSSNMDRMESRISLEGGIHGTYDWEDMLDVYRTPSKKAKGSRKVKAVDLTNGQTIRFHGNIYTVRSNVWNLGGRVSILFEDDLERYFFEEDKLFEVVSTEQHTGHPFLARQKAKGLGLSPMDQAKINSSTSIGFTRENPQTDPKRQINISVNKLTEIDYPTGMEEAIKGYYAGQEHSPKIKETVLNAEPRKNCVKDTERPKSRNIWPTVLWVLSASAAVLTIYEKVQS